MSGNRHGHTDNRKGVIKVSVGNPYVRGNTAKEKAITHNRIQDSIARKGGNKKLSDKVLESTLTAIRNK
jgi:hypothetical protein